RWDLRKNFQVGGLQPSHLALHLVLSGSEPLNGLPQRVESLRHLLRPLRVEGGDGWHARRDRLWRSVRNGRRLPGLRRGRSSSGVFGTGQRLRPARDLLPDPRRPAEFWCPCRDCLLGLLAVGLPSQGASNTNTNRDQVTNNRSRSSTIRPASCSFQQAFYCSETMINHVSLRMLVVEVMSDPQKKIMQRRP